MKRAVLFLIIFSMLATLCLCACADVESEDEGNTQEDVQLSWKDQQFDFGDQEVVFVYVEGEQGNFTEISIEPEEDDGDSVVSALYNRNRKIEEAYHVDIVAVSGASSISGLSSAINNSLASGSDDYDVIAGYQYYDLPLATKGYLLDLNTLDQYDADYLHLDENYWGGNYIDSLTYNNRMYWITGDIALRYIGGMYCTFVNSTIYRDVMEETYGTIYDVVRSGRWTLDTMLEMSNAAYKDNGNEVIDDEDRIGYVTEICDDSEAMAIAAGVKFSKRDASGGVSIAFNSDATTNFGSKYYNLCTSTGILEYSDNGSKSSMGNFAGENTLFVTNKLFQAQIYLLEMDEYYVIPLPKLDTDQEQYISYIHDGCTIFGINVSTDVLQAATASLEAMAQESYETVSPVYYNSALKLKYTRDDDSAQMIDLIHDTLTTDFAAAWSNSLNDIAHFFRSNAKTKSISSYIARASKTWGAKLDELLSDLDAASEAS